MRRTLLHLAICTLTFTIGTAASAVWNFVSPPPPTTAQQQYADEQELLRIEHESMSAGRIADIAFFDNLYASDFQLVASDGTLLNKAEALEDITESAGIYQESHLSGMRVQVFGNTAVVIGVWTGTGKDEEGDYTDHTRWTDVFVKREGRWRLLRTQVTPINGESSEE